VGQGGRLERRKVEQRQGERSGTTPDTEGMRFTGSAELDCKLHRKWQHYIYVDIVEI